MNDKEQSARQAYEKMARICSRSEQCSADIRRKMAIYDLMDEVVEEIIEKLKEEKFLNDERYAKAFATDKFRFNKWGKLKIRHALRLKNLPEALITEALNEIDMEKYKAALLKTMENKAKSIKKKTEFEKMGQIIRFTQSRGFEPELIHRYINRVLEN